MQNLVILKNYETKTPKIGPGSVSKYRVLKTGILLLAEYKFPSLPIPGE